MTVDINGSESLRDVFIFVSSSLSDDHNFKRSTVRGMIICRVRVIFTPICSATLTR
jgi:hypothetical protein